MIKRDNEKMSETELIAACKREEIWARKTLYERYAPAMFSLCIRYVSNRETARDVLQDGFFKVFTKIGDFKGTGSFEGWLKRVFITTALENLRRQRYVPLEEEYENYLIDNDLSAFDKLSADDLHQMIADLPDGFRTVFNLYVVEGYSHKEIGEMLDIKEVTSRSQYARARAVLKRKILEQ
jgi:RNA polymerase sigma-70 factor (ECF subfamily)